LLRSVVTVIIIIVTITIIITFIITFMQGIYNYIHETNHVSMSHSVAAFPYLQLALRVMLFRP